MASTYEKSIKGATKVKLAPPKSKYIEVILQATHSDESGVSDIFRTLQHRVRDSTWTIAFKALIVVHLMIREGEQNVTLRYLSTSQHRKQLMVNTYSDVQTQGRNIKNYSHYLMERARSFAKAKVDYVASGEGRLKRLSVEKGLLMETETVQNSIKALLQCDLFTDELENEITLTAFRLITMDLLALFHVMNEGAINVLEHYFEMSQPDAERALAIYKTFTKQTEQVVGFLSVARQHEQSTRLEIPKIRHAPTSLAASLEEYLNDKDFEINRRQYMVQQEAKKGGKAVSSATKSAQQESSAGPSQSAAKSDTLEQQNTVKPSTKPVADLIDFDFFESIEQNQQQMAQDPGQYQQNMFSSGLTMSPQPTGYVGQEQQFQPNPTGYYSSPSSTNPFGQPQQQAFYPDQFGGVSQPGHYAAQYSGSQNQPIQPQSTVTGFGGYSAQPIEQVNQQSFGQTAQTSFSSFGQQQFAGNQSQIQRQPTNPFRQSSMPTGSTAQTTGSPFSSVSSNTGNTGRNPFAPILENETFNQTPFQSSSIYQTQQNGMSFGQSSQSPPPMQQQATGTNPFGRSVFQQQQKSSSLPSVTSHGTGTTNPFRQSAFVNQSTGQGWQQSPQPTLGGLEQLETVHIFPRPAQSQQQQQQHPWS